MKVAIVALSDVVTSDLTTYRSSFGLPATTLTTVHSGADPGITASQGENTEDVEMVSATAPGASIVLVSDVDNATTDGLTTGILYIVNNAVAPILTMSYGACELKLGHRGQRPVQPDVSASGDGGYQLVCSRWRLGIGDLHVAERNSTLRGRIWPCG